MKIKKEFRFLILYLKKYVTSFIFGGVFIFLLSILILPTPFITRHIIDNTLPNKDISELLLLILIVFVLLITMKIINYFQSLLFYKINTKIILDIRLDLLNKINYLPLKLSKKYGTGYLISRINDDTGRLRNLFADTLISIVKDILTFVVGLTAVFFIHWKLALISISILPFFITATVYYSKRIRKYSASYYENNAQTSKQLEESLNMLELCKVFLRNKYNLLRYFEKAKIAFRSDIKLGKTSFQNSAIIGFISGIAPILIIGYGGYEIIHGRLTLGSLIAFNSFVGYLFGPTNRLINVNIQIQKSLISLQRVREIFELPEEKINENFIIKEKVNILTFDKVSFTYDKGEEININAHKSCEQNSIFDNLKNSGLFKKESLVSSRCYGEILKEICFSVKGGEKIGIVGSSGSGKTTLMRILAGLFEVNKGQIILNSNVLTNTELVALRKYIAIVEQEPYLFNDTIYNNIRFGNPRSSEKNIVDASRKANADDFIRNLPNGYKTIVGQRGNNISVGQKQRIAIARALVKNPKILILDEATSNIDTISETYINKTIFSLPDNILVFIIAHKLKNIKNCDYILVMNEGRIVEEGKHTELLDRNGIYRALYPL